MGTVSASFASKRTKILQDSERYLMKSDVASMRFSFGKIGVKTRL